MLLFLRDKGCSVIEKLPLNQTFTSPFFGKKIHTKLKSNHIFVLDTVRKICKAPNPYARHKKLANTNYHYIVCTWNFWWNVGFIHDYFKDHYTFIIRHVCILSIAHVYTTGHSAVIKVIFVLICSCINFNIKANTEYRCMYMYVKI